MELRYHKRKLNANVVVNALLAKPNEFVVEAGLVDASIEFPDVSKYQRTIDWRTMSSKTKNIIIRAMHQTIDTKFRENWAAAKQFSIKRGLYLFYDDRMSPGDQLTVLANIIKDDLPEGTIWVDWEAVYGGSFGGLKNVVALMEAIERRFPGHPVGLYTGYYFFVENSNAILNRTHYEYLKTHALWLAQYTNNTILKVPYPWKIPELHQYGTPVRGREFGCESLEIDMNRVVSNVPFYIGDAPVPPPAGETMDTINPPEYYRVTTTTYVNIRSVPGVLTTATDIGDIFSGGIVKADGKQVVGTTTWFHIIDARDSNGNPIKTSNGLLVSERLDCWVTGQYLELVTQPIPTIQPPKKVVITDANGVVWECTTFTRVT